jgi:hypothetical protein
MSTLDVRAVSERERQADLTRVFEQMETFRRNPAGIYVPLYERHGFEVVGSIQAGSSPTIVPMLRRPRYGVAFLSLLGICLEEAGDGFLDAFGRGRVMPRLFQEVSHVLLLLSRVGRMHETTQHPHGVGSGPALD